MNESGSGTCPYCGMLIDLPTWAYGHACNPETKKRYEQEQKRQKKLLEVTNG